MMMNNQDIKFSLVCSLRIKAAAVAVASLIVCCIAKLCGSEQFSV